MWIGETAWRRQACFANAAVRHEAEYALPIEHHNAMELFATTAVWESDGKITICEKNPGLAKQSGLRLQCFSADFRREMTCVSFHALRRRGERVGSYAHDISCSSRLYAGGARRLRRSW